MSQFSLHTLTTKKKKIARYYDIKYFIVSVRFLFLRARVLIDSLFDKYVNATKVIHET